MENKKIYLGVGLAFLLLMTISLSYAYFSTNVSGNDNAKDVVVNAGTLSLVYTDGPEIKVENIRPGKTITKEVTVKNTGTLDTNYNIIWQSLINEITNDELVLSATCERLNSTGTVEGTCTSISQAPISDTTIGRKISIESGITHKYTFTITFKETNTDQNYNQGKKFNGVLGIEEYKTPDFSTESWSTIIANVRKGYENEYIVGSTKEIDMGDYGTHTLRIANTSTSTECNTEGFSQTSCGFVLEFADIITTHAMNDTDTNVGGWPATSMRSFVNNDIYNSLPTDLKNAIIDTTVVSGHGSTSGEENYISSDKLYLLSPAEICAESISSSNNITNTKFNINIFSLPIPEPIEVNGNDSARNLTKQLDYYKKMGVTIHNNHEAIKKNGTSSDIWWLRTATSNYNHFFYYVSSGNVSGSYASSSYGVSPAFRIG